jgi:hypothetical protein
MTIPAAYVCHRTEQSAEKANDPVSSPANTLSSYCRVPGPGHDYFRGLVFVADTRSRDVSFSGRGNFRGKSVARLKGE